MITQRVFPQIIDYVKVLPPALLTGIMLMLAGGLVYAALNTSPSTKASILTWAALP